MMLFGVGMFGLLFMLLFWVGLIALAVWLVRGIFSHDGLRSTAAAGRELSPGEILDQRYARGEIDREEFEAKKRDLVA